MQDRKGRYLAIRSFTRCRSCFIFLIIAIAAASGLTGCGSGGSGGSASEASVTALDLPSRITLSSGGGSSNSASARAASFRPPLSARHQAPSAFGDADTEYSQERKTSWVEDIDTFDVVNDILGVLAESGYQNFVNAGPYKALVKPVGSEQQSQADASSTSTVAEQLMEIIVDATRESATAPMILKVWVLEENGPGGAAMLIRGYFIVTRGVSDEYPYGAMEAHFKANLLDVNGVEGEQVFTLVMSIGADAEGNVIVQSQEQGAEPGGPGGPYIWDFRSRIVANSTLTAGNAYVYTNETDWDTGIPEIETLYYAHNEDYLKYQAAGSPEPTVKDKNNLRRRIYDYKLFDYETGAKVTRSSGFGVALPGGKSGYVGYYGLWTPYGATVSAGDTVTRADNGESYTLFNVGGKLTRHTRASIGLSELDGMEIAVSENGQTLIVVWNAAAEKFQKIGTRNSMGRTDYLDPSAYLDYDFANAYAGGRCEALSAHLRLGQLTPANSDTVYYHVQETVSGALSENLTLYFWGFALDEPVTQNALDTSVADYSAYFAGTPVKKTYIFDATTKVLSDSELNPIILTEGLGLTGSKYPSGYWLFPMTTADTYDTGNCWSIQDSETYYTWSTGPNAFNQFTTLQDADGNLLGFDRPLKFNYTHSTANDANADPTFDGRIFVLEYDGSQLRIPWKYDADSDEWCPSFNLKDATVLTDSDGNRYVVKAVEEALIMADAADPALAADLVIDTTIAPPELVYDEAKTDLVGAVPTGVEIKIIKGELAQN